MDDKRKYVKYIVCLIIIPMILIIGYKAFGEKRYAFITYPCSTPCVRRTER